MNQDFQEIIDLVAQVASDYKSAKADGKIDFNDILLIGPIMLKVPAAIEGAKVAFKDLDVAQVKAAAQQILDAAGDVDPKHALYVDKAFSIVSHVVGIVEDVKAIHAA